MNESEHTNNHAPEFGGKKNIYIFVYVVYIGNPPGILARIWQGANPFTEELTLNAGPKSG